MLSVFMRDQPRTALTKKRGTQDRKSITPRNHTALPLKYVFYLVNLNFSLTIFDLVVGANRIRPGRARGLGECNSPLRWL